MAIGDQFHYYQTINVKGDSLKVYNNRDFLIEVSRGNVSGFSHIHKYGHNDVVGGSFETVWDGSNVYTYISATTILTLSSDDTNDTIAGTGARTIEIFGLDSGYTEINETVILSGQTGIDTINSYLRIYRMIVRSAGSTGGNVGKLYAGTGTITGGVPANIFAQIMETNNQTLMAVYTIPIGKIGFLLEKFANTNKDKETEIQVIVRPFGEVFQVKQQDVLFQTDLFHSHRLPESYEEKTDIEMRGKVAVGSASMGAGFDLLLIDSNLTF